MFEAFNEQNHKIKTKVKIIKQKPMKLTKIFCHVLMTKNNEYELGGLALGYQTELLANSYFSKYLEQLFWQAIKILF